MLEDIHNQLMKTRETVRQKQKLEAMLVTAQQTLAEEQANCEALKKQLDKEQSDVNNLAGISLTALFYIILGTKERRLKKEQQDLLAAKLKHEEGVQVLAETQQEVSELQDRLVALGNPDTEYADLIQRKEQLLLKAGDERTKRLLALSEQLADLQSDRKELQEAIAAGEADLLSLEEVRKALKSAENWGTWDMMGGGVFVTMAKHDAMDGAKRHAHEAQVKLRKFREELADAGERLHVSMELDGFTKFADYFLDNIITDWVVQSKIQKSMETCVSTISQVTSAVNTCRQKFSATHQELETVKRNRLECIEKS